MVLRSLYDLFGAIGLVMIGTYCLYLSLGVLLLDWLKRIPKLYYNPKYFLLFQDCSLDEFKCDWTCKHHDVMYISNCYCGYDDFNLSRDIGSGRFYYVGSI